ncbi:hypothetical protein M8J77_003995 [Diaphorina citri]|nr:hypothetical protein M8J77_003995 [Diaphorina citri]
MGVLVDSNSNWTPSPPKKKWMMHYLEEFSSSEDKPSSCYTNGVSGSNLGSVITTLSPDPAAHPLSHLHHSLPTTTIINTTNHITFTNGLPSSLLHRPLERKEELLLTTTSNGAHFVESVSNVQQPVISTPVTHPAAVMQRHYTLHIEDEMMGSREVVASLSGETRLVAHNNYTSNSHAVALSTSPNNLTQNDMIKKRSGISGIREVHNKLEKNRRAHLKECFEILKRQVPPAQEEKKSSNLSILHSAIRYIQEEKKSSNLSILHSAIRYIQFLRRREREFEHEMERLAREKIHAQQRLALLKKELSARWEHIDFNTLIPDNMEVDIPYDNHHHESSLLSYGKERSYMDEDGGLVIVTNGSVGLERSDGGESGSSLGGGGEMISGRGEGEYGRAGSSSGASNLLKCSESTLYSSNSSLSSTMSPLHNQTHIQVVSSSNVTSSSTTSSSLPLHLLSSSNVRMLPLSGESPLPIALTVHTSHVNGGAPKSSPPRHHSPSSASLSPLPSSPSTTVIVTDSSSSPSYIKLPYRPTQSTCPSVIQSSVINTLSASNGVPASAGYNGKPATSPAMVPATPVSTNGMSTATIIKSGDSIPANVTPKLVSLNSLPGLVSAHHSAQVLFTSSQHPKMLSSTSVVTSPPVIKPLPSLQPISSHQIILKPSLAQVNGAPRLVLPHHSAPVTMPAKTATRIVHK